jgi:hypothetical protein
MDGMVGEQVAAPDLIQAVRGYKILSMMPGTGLLSPYHRISWREREQKAHCNRWRNFASPPPNHSAPDRECKCGLYAFHEVDEYHHRYTPIFSGIMVVALTSSRGRIQVHERGFRSEYQRIEAIAVDLSQAKFHHGLTATAVADRLDALMAVVETWGIPYAPDIASLPDIAEGMGLQPIPESLLPTNEDPTPEP